MSRATKPMSHSEQGNNAMSERMKKLPIHPWHTRLTDLPSGKGNFYHYGPNYTVDPIVIASEATPKILLIRRGDTGDWALPGGFIDGDETATHAAQRELYEETGITLNDTEPTIVYEGPVADPRSTLNAWPETTALLWRCGTSLAAQANDDARDARWFALSNLPQNLYGSHADIIRHTILTHGTWAEQLAYCLEQSNTSQPTGGHMGYERTVVHMPHQAVFIKQHNAQHFTDGEREAHSRHYLQKEYAVYTQLQQHPHLPCNVQLVGDSMLLLEAYTDENDWHWRAPEDTLLQDRYITETLAALAQLRTATYTDTSMVAPTHITLKKEGWECYGEHRTAIITALAASPIAATNELAATIDSVYEQYIATPERPLDSFCHGDLRQSNMAWHPTEGVRMVDWSWAGKSASGLDATSFLIDLAKSGIDVRQYKKHFAIDQALLLIGFWLHHSTWPTHGGDTTVRQQQIASAVTAWQLVQLFTAPAQGKACEQ